MIIDRIIKDDEAGSSYEVLTSAEKIQLDIDSAEIALSSLNSEKENLENKYKLITKNLSSSEKDVMSELITEIKGKINLKKEELSKYKSELNQLRPGKDGMQIAG